ncbi:hypothetical protein BC943DRAFT_318756 [Umbelopsis sp. AD052]|nr:hypothetical protein BC943DRAFT_318756 [Umbelopsis sp. AD052]
MWNTGLVTGWKKAARNFYLIGWPSPKRQLFLCVPFLRQSAPMKSPQPDLPSGAIIESDSPEPALLEVSCLTPEKDYREQSWKNGLGQTAEIAIYPKQKNFIQDTFFWRFSVSTIQANCNFSLFPGYECTTIVLPNGSEQKSTLLLNHRGEEVATNIKQLFPYTWSGEWSTSCKVTNPPVHNLQFLINRELGKAQFHVEKIGQPVSTENGETGRKMILGSFALVYVVDGHVRIGIDENHAQGHARVLSKGHTLYIERDEEASPTNLMIQASDEKGGVGNHDLDATVAVIMITENKHQGAPSTVSDYISNTITKPIGPLTVDPTSVPAQTPQAPQLSPPADGNAPSQRRVPRRKGSLVVYDDQPLWNLPPDLAQKLASKEAVASSNAFPVTTEIGGELAQLIAKGDTAAAEKTLQELRKDSIGGTTPARKWESAQAYEPPTFETQDTEVPPPVVRDRLVIEDFPVRTISTAWIKMIRQGLSEWIRLPVIVCRGTEEGPVVGITAAVHGNELNGVPCIHRVVSDIDIHKLTGTVVAVPCVNVTGYLKFTREFADGKDLNRYFPGKEDGFASQVYAYQLMQKIISQFNYLIDLHTASFGRVNSYYVRSDMNDPISAVMAHLQQPQVILHNSGQDGTLRSAAASRGIKAITVEIGNPQLFQNQYVQWSYMGVMRILDHLEMFKMDNAYNDELDPPPPTTVLCSKGFWIYTRTGGVLEVYPGVNNTVKKGDLIARIKNIFGNVVDEYFAPCAGITIGRSSNPVAMAGDRIIHLGVIKKKGEMLPKEAKENY